MISRAWLGGAACLLLAGCATPSVQRFAGTTPVFDPMAFFTGHVTSWGVIEDRAGGPSDIITTDCVGAVGPDGVLHLVQRLTIGDKLRSRDWTLRRDGPGRYRATASDMVGEAVADVAGRALHWRYTLVLDPHNSLKNVAFEQWIYLLDDGSTLDRATLSKFGVIAAEVTEHFTRAR